MQQFDPTQTAFEGEEKGAFKLVSAQHIPQEFIDDLSDHRKAQSAMSRSRELHRVGSIPVIFVEKWLKEGFDIYREDARAILRRLKQEDLHDFITTEYNL